MAKRKTRISGSNMKTGEGLAYTVQTADGWRFDADAVKRHVDAYLAEAAETGKYSIAGLCIALNVSRATLGLWREGYVCARDAGDTAVMPDEKLAECVEMALLHLQRYWEECDKPSSMSLKQLEATGALGESYAAAVPPFDLGRFKKYAR